MSFYDVLFILDKNDRLLHLKWGNSDAQETYHLLFDSWISRSLCASAVFPIPKDQSSGSFVWDEDTFSFEKLPAPNDEIYLFLMKQKNREYLFMKALDHVPDGIQIYDKNACAVFFNKSSRRISQIPPDVNIEGRFLLDMYHLDENVSTTMTCLRTQSPVHNRVDHYTSNASIAIATANTAYPIKKGNELLGSVVFEQDQNVIDTYSRKMDELDKALKHYHKHAHLTSFSGYSFDNIIGHGEKLLSAISVAKKVASQNSAVLLVGETGTGKEIFAQSIHRASERKGKKFLAINCAAIPDSLIESLLFGTQKGSFTGSEDKPGYFEEANGGTLFLDELNSMSLNMQSKILRAIQENTFRRVGGQKDIKLDVRIISSCNEDPFRSIAENHFRKDLFYRLSTVMIELPALREHMEDLEELIRYHLKATSFQYVNALTDISPEAFAALRAYTWPGNVRELYHVLDYAQNVAEGSTMLLEHLPSYLLKKENPKTSSASEFSVNFDNDDLQSLMDTYENQVLSQALEHFGYNISKTADALGIRRQSLQYRIKKYGIII